jgi:hypothetical protein
VGTLAEVLEEAGYKSQGQRWISPTWIALEKQCNVVDATLDKLIVMERARLEIEAESLTGQLRPFEQRYQLPSAEFHRRFRAGEMGDDADMFEWSAFYQMWLSVHERLEALRPERSL